jgi:hypothetical protein
VRAYVVSDHGLAYGNELLFTTGSSGSGGHVYVDLGLPSGALWATCNVGADNPEDYGDYFAWGETQPKDSYSWDNYLYGSGYNQLTKYCYDSYYGYNGFADTLTVLLPEDDAVTANWGTDWRMPNNAEWNELYYYTTKTQTTQNGVYGTLFTGENGNSIFLPAAGCWYNESPNDIGQFGYYWSNKLYNNYPSASYYFTCNPDGTYYLNSIYDRFVGRSVRAVRTVPLATYTINATANPEEAGWVIGADSYREGAECTLVAEAYEEYIFINWTEDGEVVSTDATYSFIVTGNRNLVANYVINDGTYHAYVDLGLPSGLLWATCNVGADSPEDYGDYFAWGETQPKSDYSWSTYQYCMGSYNTLTKYCSNASYGYNGFTDDLTTLLPEDDAATANWGSDWRMPTKEEWQELYNNTTHTWTTQNGVNGRLFTASNGNSLFLPAAGFRSNGGEGDLGSRGKYWSSSLNLEYQYSYDAKCFSYSSGSFGLPGALRDDGFSVRPVRSASQSTSFVIDATANPVEGGVVIGGGSYQFGAECTLTATANEGYIFNNWMENDSVVSTQASYQFIVTGNLTLVASFTYVQPTYSISVSTNPSVGGIVVGDGTYTEGQSCTVTAIANTNYVFTSWIENGNVVSTDATYTFSVTNDRILVANFNVVYNGHEYVDLGLPSGALWATCNVGATTPEGYGNLYSWYYDFGNMPANMPTIEQWRELANNTTGTWTNQDGVNGWLYTASNGNTLFLPAAGYQSGNAIFRRGSEGDYWSKTPTLNSNMYFVWIFNSSINSNGYSGECDYGIGCSVRQVLTP